MAWLESPVLADRAQKLGEFCRYETSLPPAPFRTGDPGYGAALDGSIRVVRAQEGSAKGGLDPAIVEDIANRRQPRFQERRRTRGLRLQHDAEHQPLDP